MPDCPFCGSTNLEEASCPDCGARPDLEFRIASWVGPASEASGGVAATPEAICGACGYSGEMIPEPRGTTCPACGVTAGSQRSEAATNVSGIMDCPECGRKIGLTTEDEGRTVVCPGCSCFLGTFQGGAKGSSPAGRRHRGR